MGDNLRWLHTSLLCFLVLPAAIAYGQSPGSCDDQLDQCDERLETESATCWAQCERRYGNDIDMSRWDRCTDRCDEARDRGWGSCDEEHDRCTQVADSQSGSSEINSPYAGSRSSGEDGCYFGECPDGDEINNAPPMPTGGGNSGPQTPPQEMPQQPKTYLTSICQTPTFWCRMNVQGPVGYQCYCSSYYGPITGFTVAER